VKGSHKAVFTTLISLIFEVLKRRPLYLKRLTALSLSLKRHLGSKKFTAQLFVYP
jgi:hypothetical protein